MRIAIASGKGGTGKTTVATNLATLLGDSGQQATYVDCDVEAPNGHLFLKPEITGERPVLRLVPVVNQDKCTHCGACARFCHFNAITKLPKVTLVHPELCHSCGGCSFVCPASAIREEDIPVGIVRTGMAGSISFAEGRFRVGMANSTPVIRAAKEAGGNSGWVILDAPPGTSCAMIETIKNCDYVILVTEPTRFGIHDLNIAMEVVGKFGIPFGVVVNRSDEASERVRSICERAAAGVIGELPCLRNVAEAYSEGDLAIHAFPEMKTIFAGILKAAALASETAASSAGTLFGELSRAPGMKGIL